MQRYRSDFPSSSRSEASFLPERDQQEMTVLTDLSFGIVSSSSTRLRFSICYKSSSARSGARSLLDRSHALIVVVHCITFGLQFDHLEILGSYCRGVSSNLLSFQRSLNHSVAAAHLTLRALPRGSCYFLACASLDGFLHDDREADGDQTKQSTEPETVSKPRTDGKSIPTNSSMVEACIVRLGGF